MSVCVCAWVCDVRFVGLLSSAAAAISFRIQLRWLISNETDRLAPPPNRLARLKINVYIYKYTFSRKSRSALECRMILMMCARQATGRFGRPENNSYCFERWPTKHTRHSIYRLPFFRFANLNRTRRMNCCVNLGEGSLQLVGVVGFE